MKRRIRWTMALATMAMGCGPGAADYVFTNGFVHTVDDANPQAEAVAVVGDQIVYVGDSDGAQAYVGESTEVVDLDGRMLLPGFVDSHLHALAGALIAKGSRLETDSREELLEMIRAHIAANPGDDLIVSFGWRPHLFPDTGPRKEELDAIESERPVYLWSVDGHSAWVNSRVLELAGIDADHPETQPPFSFYQRDADGTPTGWVVEVPAQLETLGRLTAVGPDYIEEGFRSWIPRFSAAGITTLGVFIGPSAMP